MRPATAAELFQRTATLLAESRQLHHRLAATRADSKRVRRLPPRTIRGGGGLDGARRTDPVRLEIRRRLAEGTLPLPSTEPWAGRGSGEPCAICGAAIQTRDIEYELPFQTDVPHGKSHVCVHLRCYEVWRQEARTARSLSSEEGAGGA